MAIAPFANMNAQQNDAFQTLLVKAVYFAAAAAKASGGTLPTAPYANMNPQHNDAPQVLLVKLVYWLSGISGGGGGGGGLTTQGIGAPPVDGSVKNGIYEDTNTGFFYFNTGTVAAPVWVRH